MPTLRLFACLPLMALGLFTGCTATYVNIPALTNDVAVHSPNAAPVPKVLETALLAVLEDQPVDGDFQVLLPEKLTPKAGAPIFKALGPNAKWIVDGHADAALPTFEARQVRIRGWLAQVDILQPRDLQQPAGFRQLVTVDLRWDFAYGWHTLRLRRWNANPDDALKISAHTEIQAQGVRPTQTQGQPLPGTGPGSGAVPPNNY